MIICWPGECASDISEPSERGAHPVLLSPRGFWRGKIRICFKLIFKVIAIILIGWKSEWMKNNISCTILLQKVREARQPFRDVAPGEEVQNLLFTSTLVLKRLLETIHARKFNLWLWGVVWGLFCKISKNALVGFRGKRKHRVQNIQENHYVGYKKEVEGIYIFDLTGQHSVDSPPKESRKYLATCKVGFKSDKNDRKKEMSWFLFPGSTPPKWWMSTEALPSGFFPK